MVKLRTRLATAFKESRTMGGFIDMKKLSLLFLLALLALTACGRTAEPQVAPQDEPALAETPSPTRAPIGLSALCHECGYVHEPLREPTPPLNIHELFAPWQGQDADFPQAEHEANVAEFVRGFDNVHTATYIQFEANWYSTIILWTDTPLRDFSFVSLDVAGHEWTEAGQLVIGTQEVLLTVDELLPNDAVVLNVAFSHYLLPHGAIIFTDEQGELRRMFIREDMRGGCYPSYRLVYDDNFAETPNISAGETAHTITEAVYLDIPVVQPGTTQVVRQITFSAYPASYNFIFDAIGFDMYLSVSRDSFSAFNLNLYDGINTNISGFPGTWDIVVERPAQGRQPSDAPEFVRGVLLYVEHAEN